MIVLDENVVEGQRIQLQRWRIRVSQIGLDVGRAAMQDHEIIPLLRTLRRPTFVSWDRHFFDRSLASDHDCLVYADVRPSDVARFTRRLIRHREFKTWAQRKGCVIRVSPSGLTVWRVGMTKPMRLRWHD